MSHLWHRLILNSPPPLSLSLSLAHTSSGTHVVGAGAGAFENFHPKRFANFVWIEEEKKV